MISKKTNPFIGLSRINKREYAGAGVFDLLNIVEEQAPSFQEGETRDMFLFLHFINILMKAEVDFLVQGGILLATVLNDHCRRTHDIDVIVKDPDRFYADVKSAVSNSGSEIEFEVAYVKKKEASEQYYKNTFAFRVTAYRNREAISIFIIDGVYIDYYDEIEREKYLGPEIINKGFYFYGVDMEYVASVKILAVSSELPRPVKHLVDLYGLTKVKLDIGKVKKHLKSCLWRENIIRRRLGKPELNEDYSIKSDKQFLGNYVYEAISGGYKLGFKEMKEQVNAWIESMICT